MRLPKLFAALLLLCATLCASAQTTDDYPADYARAPRFKALLCYDTQVEPAYVEFADAVQNLLFINAFRWIVSRDPQGDPFVSR